MRLKALLQRLAHRATKKRRYDYAAGLEWQRQEEAWLRGEGPGRPPEPCPYWWGPEAWASRQRISGPPRCGYAASTGRASGCRTGKHWGQSPYERLGLKLPPLPWWGLLKLSPEELRQQLSAQAVAA